METDFFSLLYSYLEDREPDSVSETLSQDADFIKASQIQNELLEKYNSLDLTEKQRDTILCWTEAIMSQSAAYSIVLFRLTVQYYFSLFMQKENVNVTDSNQLRQLYRHLKEREHNNIFQNLSRDEYYQETSQTEKELYQKYMNLGLSEKNRKIIEQWIESMHNQNEAYYMVIFCMGMQCCASLLKQLTGFDC